MIRPAPSPSRKGFTLLEVVVSIGLLAMLIAMAMTLASQNIALGRVTVEKQAEVSVDQAFMELLSRQFSSLPGNARLELTSEDVGRRYLSNLTLQNVPMTFTWGGEERVAKAVRITTVPRRGDTVNVVLQYFETEILEGTTESGEPVRVDDAEPFAEVVLLEDVFIFEWEVLDGRTLEWFYDWDLVGRLPLQLRLSYVPHPGMDVQTDTIRHIFWITPKQNPEVVMRQMQQGGQGNQNGSAGGNPDGPGGGGAPGAGGGPGGGVSLPQVDIQVPQGGGR